MPDFQTITLDTTGPSSPTMTLNAGAPETDDRNVSALFQTGDPAAVGYEVKVWGDLDLTWAIANGLADPAAAAPYDEADAEWVAWQPSRSLRLSSGDGDKAVSYRFRDAVYNQSVSRTESIRLAEAAPLTVTVLAPTADTVSKQAGKDSTDLSWSVDGVFEEYVVKVVPDAASVHTDGVPIPSAGGSLNVAGVAGGYPANTPIVTTVTGVDLEAAAGAGGAKVVKVFVLDAAGRWSA